MAKNRENTKNREDARDRESTVNKYLLAYELYKNGNMSWSKAKKKARVGHSYPLIELDNYVNASHRRSVVSDLIGFKNRVANLEQNKPFFKALSSQGIYVYAEEYNVSTRESKLSGLTDGEIVFEMLSRGIKTDDGKVFYKEEMKRTNIEPYPF